MTHWSKGTTRPLSHAYSGACCAGANASADIDDLLLGDGRLAAGASALQKCGVQQHPRRPPGGGAGVASRSDMPVGPDEHPGRPPDVVIGSQPRVFVVHDGDLGRQITDLVARG